MAYFDKAKMSNGTVVDVQDTKGRALADSKLDAAKTELNNAITTKVNKEADARQKADTAIRSDLTSESNARADADSALEMKINNIAETYVNVKKYGAKGDGITDDTDSVNRALNNSGCVYFPKGTYIINSPILLNDGQSIIGDGPGNTIIKAASSFSGIAVISTKKFNQINNIDNGDTEAGFNTIKNITIDGSAWNPYYLPSTKSESVPPTVRCGGMFLAGTGFTVDNVKIFNCYTNAIYLNRQQIENWNKPMNALSKFANIDIGTCGQHAVHLTGKTNTDTQWVNMHVANGSCSVNNGYFNLLIELGANAKFTNCHFASQYGHKKVKYSVCLSSTASGCVFSNGDIEGSFDSNLRVENNGNTFTNCRFYACFGNPGNNISFSNSASKNIFSACTFSGSASDDIFTGSFGWDIYGNGGAIAGSNSYNSFINCVTSNEKIAYFNSQWKNTIYIGTCTANKSNFTFESQPTNRAIITGGDNQQINI